MLPATSNNLFMKFVQDDESDDEMTLMNEMMIRWVRSNAVCDVQRLDYDDELTSMNETMIRWVSVDY